MLGKQAATVAAVGACSFAVSYALGWIVDRTVGFRVAPDDEQRGVDQALHAETAYEFGTSPAGGFGGTARHDADNEMKVLT